VPTTGASLNLSYAARFDADGVNSLAIKFGYNFQIPKLEIFNQMTSKKSNEFIEIYKQRVLIILRNNIQTVVRCGQNSHTKPCVIDLGEYLTAKRHNGCTRGKDIINQKDMLAFKTPGVTHLEYILDIIPALGGTARDLTCIVTTSAHATRIALHTQLAGYASCQILRLIVSPAKQTTPM
jgi:hypothetical protein